MLDVEELCSEQPRRHRLLHETAVAQGRDGRLPFVTLADLTLARLSGVTNVRLGIADGGPGIFAVDGPDCRS